MLCCKPEHAQDSSLQQKRRTCSDKRYSGTWTHIGAQVTLPTLKGLPIELCKQLNMGALENSTKLNFLENKEARF